MTGASDTPATVEGSEPPFSVRAVGAAEVGFILSSWSQSHMRSPGQPFGSEHDRLVRPMFERLLRRGDVWIIGAFGPHDGRPDAILGWLAWTPGELPALHYAFTRGPLRKQGVFTELLRHAALGKRFLVTSRGQKPKYRRNAPTYDKRVLDALARRGVAAAYVPLADWLERMER